MNPRALILAPCLALAGCVTTTQAQCNNAVAKVEQARKIAAAAQSGIEAACAAAGPTPSQKCINEQRDYTIAAAGLAAAETAADLFCATLPTAKP